MRAFAHDLHTYALPPGHRFPLGKYRLVREGAASHSWRGPSSTRRRRRARELPCSPTPPTTSSASSAGRSRRAGRGSRSGCPGRPGLDGAGAPVGRGDAPRRPRRRSWTAPVANVGGGTHHAFAEGGRGFCVFNDVVVGDTRAAAGRAGLVVWLVVDLDVHQGDGTHAAFARDEAEGVHVLRQRLPQLPAAARARRPRPRSPRTARATSATSTRSPGSSPRLSKRAPARSSASTSPEPTRTRATAWAASRSPRWASGLARDRLVRDLLLATAGARVRHPRRRLCRPDRGHGRHSSEHAPYVRR